jgi:hypothetical protein
MQSVVVCVDFDDYLAITLPNNLQLFDRTLVVTSPQDKKTIALAERYRCHRLITDSFYDQGAAFNKGLALEEAFCLTGRSGWICVWDVDILIPETDFGGLCKDCLYVPIRRMLADPRDYRPGMDWSRLPSPTLDFEFSGYCQIFHSDAVPPPWYSTCWPHAGCSDSDFAAKFPACNRLRPPFEVLHLGLEGTPGVQGRVGQNWMGRVSPRIDDGSVPELAPHRLERLKRMISNNYLRVPVEERIV